MINKTVLYMLVLTCALLISCDQKGPAEKMGESLDDATDNAKSSLQAAGEAIDESVNDTKRSIEDASD